VAGSGLGFAILQYLDRGGNLLTLGGKPFTRAAYEDASGWHLRAESAAQTLELFIDGYQETPGSRRAPSSRPTATCFRSLLRLDGAGRSARWCGFR
jgi:hypothetical protein